MEFNGNVTMSAFLDDDEEKLLISKKKVLRKIYGPVRNKLTTEYERTKNTNFESLYNKPNIKCLRKVKHLEWAGYIR